MPANLHPRSHKVRTGHVNDMEFRHIPTANDTGLGPRNESKRIQNWPRVLRLAIVILLHVTERTPTDDDAVRSSSENINGRGASSYPHESQPRPAQGELMPEFKIAMGDGAPELETFLFW
nr:hypothetical protein Iba_chr01eCG1020 [Ipomoea batatas]